MYEDAWYNFAADKKGSTPKQTTKVQYDSLSKPSTIVRLNHDAFLNNPTDTSSTSRHPPKATLARRAKSYSDFYHVVRAHITQESRIARRQELARGALGIREKANVRHQWHDEKHEAALQKASLEHYVVYKNQLVLAEQHLDALLDDTTASVRLLSSLSASFKTVEEQTTVFQSQCEDLLADQKRLRTLGEEVRSGLQYYSLLEPIIRRLNAPGASRAIGDDSFVDILNNLEHCIDYMMEHSEDRESDTYLTRYRALLVRTLNLIRIKFEDIISTDTAQAIRRFPTGRLNMTSVFVIQAPQTNPIANQLDSFMEKIRGLAYGPQAPIQRDGRRYRSNYEAEYVDIFRQLLELYIVKRRQITTPIIDKLLVQDTIKDNVSDEVAKWTRDCFQANLEVAANEHAKYALLFVGTTDARQLPGSYDAFSFSKRLFDHFLTDLATAVIVTVKPRWLHLEIVAAIELVVWLRQYDYQTLAEENGTASSTEDDLIEDANGDVIVKARLATQFKEALTTLVFERMNAILAKEVEKYAIKPEDLEPRSAVAASKMPATGNGTNTNGATNDVAEIHDAHLREHTDSRAESVLGGGLLNAFAPVKTAIRLLTIYIDLVGDYNPADVKSDIAYNIMHQTCQAIMRAVAQMTSKHSSIDARIFAIKNLVLLKNIILAYEISGAKRAAAIDFSPLYNSFSELRSRGGLFDVRAYYDLLTTSSLLPRVVENFEDARAELDGLMREQITKFREECADMLWTGKGARRGPVKDEWKVKAGLLEKLEIMFSCEVQLRENLWRAVEATLAERRLDFGDGTRIV